MDKNKLTDIYDDGNIPETDLPKNNTQNSTKEQKTVEPLPESFRPRKDGPGGE